MPTTKVVVNIVDEPPYDVRIGVGQFDGLGQRLRGVSAATRALVVTDSNVAPLYLAAVKASLAQAGFKPSQIVVPAGEASKSVACIAEIWQAMAALQLSRDALVVALGGGVVGDIAGFTASTYMRGIDFVQVPTTLLAMVDSSVGGKTGINLDAGKNLVGTFAQPLHVCASTDTLQTLPAREWACGCAEIAKSACIDSDDFFFWLTEHADLLAARDADAVEQAIARCVVCKANVVAADQFESRGVRECLNYGHTLGHAIELLAGYGVYSHGQAVAEGMRFAAGLSVAVLGVSNDFALAQDAMLDALGLPALDFAASPESVFAAMQGDKKARGGHVRFVLMRDVGAWEVTTVEPETVLEQLAAWQRLKG
ncbi:MAG: 3-dehydroquinate synthase [Raoultibacter sp.]